MATPSDVLLDHLLPHVETGVINDAQKAIADLRWHDNSDSPADFELDIDRLSALAYSLLDARSESNSSPSLTSFCNGGLSPPRVRRPVTFSNLDGSHCMHQMSEDIEETETGDIKAADGRVGGGPPLPPQDIDIIELSRQLAGHQPQSLRPRTGLAKKSHDMESDANHCGVNVPVRQSLKRVNGNGLPRVHSPGSPPNGVDIGRSRVPPIILEDDDVVDRPEDADQDFVQPSALYQAPSRRRPETSSSTPTPIRNVSQNRMFMYPKDDGAAGDDMDDRGYESNDSRLGARRPATAVVAPLTFEGSRKPPLASHNGERNHERNHERRFHSMSSENMRTPRSRVRGSPMSGVPGPHHDSNGRPPVPNGSAIAAAQSRSATLTANYRDPRNPVPNYMQMYQDAGPSRPLIDPGRAVAGARTPHARRLQARPHRSYENSMHTGYSAGYDEMARTVSWRRTYSDDEIPVRNAASISGQTNASTALKSGALPDFFSSSIFNVVLHNPTTAHQLLKFSETRLCAENVEFLSRVDEYRMTLNKLASQMAGIHRNFVSPKFQSQVNVKGNLLRQTHKEMKSLINNAFPSMETVFSDLQAQIETLVFQDIYPSFVRHQMALSATKALGSDRFRYQGLGDCFTLTDPNIADNPILYASDGFVKITGYSRSDIIPRNCRFLQGAHTDSQPVKRLSQAIDERKEIVELLLNYKKNGDPFWNLLYVAPLYNTEGKLQFFIGGQVNCSTTINSNVDVMKVLSLSNGEDAGESDLLRTPSEKQPPIKASARRALLKAFGVRLEDEPMLPQVADAGMQDGVLNRMKGQDLGCQMREFYTAYSKYLVVRAITYNIEFYSDGIVDTLNPANLTGSMVAGSEVFHFLGQNMLTKQSDYKHRVRNAMRAGVPTSTPLRLQTKRSAVFRGDETFLAHWTPLKDEKTTVQWIVITLAPMY